MKTHPTLHLDGALKPQKTMCHGQFTRSTTQAEPFPKLTTPHKQNEQTVCIEQQLHLYIGLECLLLTPPLQPALLGVLCRSTTLWPCDGRDCGRCNLCPSTLHLMVQLPWHPAVIVAVQTIVVSMFHLVERLGGGNGEQV